MGEVNPYQEWAASIHWLALKWSPNAVRAAGVSGDAGLDIIIATVSAHLARTSTGTFVGRLAVKWGVVGVTPSGVDGGGASLLSTIRESGAGGSIAWTGVKNEPIVAAGSEVNINTRSCTLPCK